MPVSEGGSESELYYGEFPTSFKFGTSSIAHQIEGTSNDDGKGVSLWDEFSHSHPKCIADRSCANESCESYRRFEDDIILLKSMNANSYSFSLNWSRILPDGTLNSLNKKGVDYYDTLINTLLENGIEPIVTIYHWDMPLALIQKHGGGWMNENMISELELFARLCFEKFGDRVQQWITIAQPWTHSWKSYGDGSHPPNLCLGSNGAFVANTNLLKAHGRIYRLYEEEFRRDQFGRIGISLKIDNDENAAVIQLGRVLYPLTHGVYPSCCSNTPENRSICRQFSTDEWESVIKESFDFIAVNFSPVHIPSLEDNSIQYESHVDIQSLLQVLQSEFDNPEVLIFCEGPSLRDPFFNTMDADRAQYFNKVANEILKAIDFNGCNVKGYFPGKLMDCWEWDDGYTISYGLYHVNFALPSKRRSPRASVAFILKQLFKIKKFLPVDTL